MYVLFDINNLLYVKICMSNNICKGDICCICLKGRDSPCTGLAPRSRLEVRILEVGVRSVQGEPLRKGLCVLDCTVANLLAHELGVIAITDHQFLMGASFRDGAAIENEDEVGVANGAQAMGNDDLCAVLVQ